MLRFPFAFVLAASTAIACGAGNAGITQCPGNRTLLDGVCVSQPVADYVACVRAQGAKLGEDKSRKLSAEAGFAGTHAAVASDVSDKLQREYSASDDNTREIIRMCGAMRSGNADVCVSAGSTLVTCGFQNDPTWLADCKKSAPYQSCLSNAGGDCNALAACGFEDNSRKWCAGAAMAGGSATCEQTGQCTNACKGEPACNCRCFAMMALSSAVSVGIVGQCFNANCAASCGTAGGQACDACFTSKCGATWERVCHGH